MTSGGNVAKAGADGGEAKSSRDSRDDQGTKGAGGGGGGGGGGGSYSSGNIAFDLSASVEKPILSASTLADIDFVTAGQMEVRACMLRV
jgi:hypothetical protein